MAALTTIALATLAAAGAYSAYETHKALEEQKKAANRAEIETREAQEKQKALADKEARESSLALKEQQARLLRGTRGRSGLLYGSELGVGDDKKQTLG